MHVTKHPNMQLTWNHTGNREIKEKLGKCSPNYHSIHLTKKHFDTLELTWVKWQNSIGNR
jgi:hypothetical protein